MMARADAGDVVPATEQDLDVILGWLEREHQEEGEGFWDNRARIRQALGQGKLWVLCVAGEAVAFQAFEGLVGIVNVRKDKQRHGLGTALFEASLERAMATGVNVMVGECAPATSLSFWEECGFTRYFDDGRRGAVLVYRALRRRLDVPEDLPRVRVKVSFFPDLVLSDPSVAPIAEHVVSAGRWDDGGLTLEERVVGVTLGLPGDGDLVVKIEVNSRVRYFGKAKRDAAELIGVQRDPQLTCYVIDELELPEH